jgi:NADH dehydrogenase
MIRARARDRAQNLGGPAPCYDSPVAQRVFVTGGTGFVGKAVIRALLAQGFLVRCLVRPGSEHDLKGFESIDRVPGDVLQPDGLAASVEGCSALVHLVGIIREQRGRGVTFDRLHTQATRNMLALARAAGIKRFAQMSALGARPGSRALSPDEVGGGRGGARERSPVDHLSAVHHLPGAATPSCPSWDAVKRLPVMPVLGDGRYRLQPIPVEQVAEASGALRTPERASDIRGRRPDAHAFARPARRDRPRSAARVRKLHVPLAPVRALTRALEWLPFYPLTGRSTC